MKMSLGPGIDMRIEQNQNIPSSTIMCMLPLFGMNLKGIRKLEKYVETLTPEDLEAIGTLSRKGSGKKAFADKKLEGLIGEINSGETDPDVRVYFQGNELRREFLGDYSYNDFEVSNETGSEEDKSGFIRDTAYFLRNIRWVGETITKIYDHVLDTQEDYLRSSDPKDLKSLTQEKLSEKLGISDSTVSRLMKNKSVRIPSGEIMSLKSLCTSENEVVRLGFYSVFAPFIRDGNWIFVSDERAADYFEEQTGIRIARRTVSKYRNALKDYADSIN